MRERTKGIWQLRVFIGTDPVTGKPVQRTKTVRVRTKTEANKALATFVAELARDRPKPEDRTVGWMIEQWIRQGAHEWAPTTLHTTRGRVDRVTLPRLGHVKLRELTTEHIDLFWGALRSGEATGHPMAMPTVRRYLADLNAALNLAVRWELLARNPATAARLPRRRPEPMSIPTAEDVGRLLSAAYAFGPRWGVLVAIAVATGARRSEVCALRWTDIEGSLVRFRRALYRAGTERGEKGLKSGGERHVYLDPDVAAILKRWRTDCEARAEAAGVHLVPDAFVVPSLPDGSRPTNPDDLSRTLRLVCDELGLPHVHTHSLRHFAITELLAGGVDARNVADIAGHANPTMTLGLYAHSTASRQQAAAGILGRVVAGALMPAESPEGSEP